MSNEAYYRFEKAFIQAIQSGEPDAVRGALAGVVKWSNSARFVVDLHDALIANSDPMSTFRADLKSIDKTGL